MFSQLVRRNYRVILAVFVVIFMIHVGWMWRNLIFPETKGPLKELRTLIELAEVTSENIPVSEEEMGIIYETKKKADEVKKEIPGLLNKLENFVRGSHASTKEAVITVSPISSRSSSKDVPYLTGNNAEKVEELRDLIKRTNLIAEKIDNIASRHFWWTILLSIIFILFGVCTSTIVLGTGGDEDEEDDDGGEDEVEEEDDPPVDPGGE